MNLEFYEIAIISIVFISTINTLALSAGIRKRQKALDQARIDLKIEREILTVNFIEIKKHSNQDLVAELRAKAIVQLIEHGASPYAIYSLLANLNVAKPILSPETEQCHFQRKIQDHLYKLLDNLDMEDWMRTSRKNKQEEWDLLQNTIFKNVRKNAFVMDLKLS